MTAHNELQRAHAEIIRQHADAIATLPDPPETFLFRDTDLSHSQMQKLRRYDIIEDVDRDGRLFEWEAQAEALEYARTWAGNGTTLPCCGASSVTNDGGTMRCKECGEEASEEALDRIFKH